MNNSNYINDVHDVTRLVPKGRVTTYGAIADFLSLGSARMVGWALNKRFDGVKVPAHRVVNRKGELSGRNQFSSPTMMEELLTSEGVSIVNNRVEDFKTRFWHPQEIENL